MRWVRFRFLRLAPMCFALWAQYTQRRQTGWAAMKLGLKALLRDYFRRWRLYVSNEKEERLHRRQQHREQKKTREVSAEQMRELRQRVRDGS
jgi:hypothetical protein